jgi:hypothetical protein
LASWIFRIEPLSAKIVGKVLRIISYFVSKKMDVCDDDDADEKKKGNGPSDCPDGISIRFTTTRVT